MPNFICCVCLNLVQNGLDLFFDAVSKLQFVVPEVDWSVDNKICETCLSHLEISYEFRQMCLKLDSERKATPLVPKIEASFSCFHCEDTFTDKDILIEHIRQTHQTIKYSCDICKKSYTTEKILKTHLKKCQKSTLTSDKSQASTRTFSCEVCDLVSKYAKKIVEHCISDHSMDRKSVRPYSCDECPMRFTSSANLIQHKKYHKGSRSHICSFCGKSYITKSDLTVHEYTHFNRRNYKCEFCVKAFNTNKNLRSHLLVVHTDPSLWRFSCDLCSRRFPLKSGFDEHMKRHNGNKEFVCQICNKSFVSRNELRKHMIFHSMEKKFQCEHCNRSYREKRLYEIHLTKIHSIGNAKIPIRERKHVCHVCPSTFVDKQKLERHLRTHSDVKPYVCANCDKKFSDKWYFKQHLKNVHGVEEVEVEMRNA